MILTRRAALATGLGALALRAARAEDGPARFFRIGTGGVAGTYYQVGGLIANAISSPPGSRPCDRGGSCGVPGLVAIVQSSEGSSDNILQVLAGTLESGFAQADTAAQALAKTGAFASTSDSERLRAIAQLYRESLHLVVAAGSGIERVGDLRGRRLAIDRPGSGTALEARALLAAAGLDDAALSIVEIGPTDALPMLAAGELDGFVMVAGWPAPAVEEAVRDQGARLVALDPELIERLVRDNAYLGYDLIPFQTYPDVPAIATVSVPALWLTTVEQPEELVFAICAALFHPTSRALFAAGHPQARQIGTQRAAEVVPLTLHRGAERWYRENGVLP